MSPLDRRRFLTLLATGASTPFLLSVAGCGGSGGSDFSFDSPDTTGQANDNIGTPDFSNIISDSESADRVFPQSVASGDPSPSGVVLWTRINPIEIIQGAPLYVQVARDSEFSDIVHILTIAPDDLTELRDYTVSPDLDTLLNSSSVYYYRFIYGNVASRTGRCKTAPPLGANLSSLKIAAVTCQDYTNGYYGAFNAIANDLTIDLVVCMGDFIYETAGDPRFQSLEFEDRLLVLPSSDNYEQGSFDAIGVVAMDLGDYRELYRTYRTDPFLLRALENHTWVWTRDDHETGNDAYWDYEKDTLGLPDHPYTLENFFKSTSEELLNQLMLDSQQAWLEYVPARVTFDLEETHPHRRLKYYRHLQFGDLLDLFMMDSRTYRSAHPTGEGEAFERYGVFFNRRWTEEYHFDGPFDEDKTDRKQTMLGPEQFNWLVDGLNSSSTKWQLLGNQTFMGPIWFGFFSQDPNAPYQYIWPVNVDAWDGFHFERTLLANEIKRAGVENLVVLTGDLHSYIASHVKVDYLDESEANAENFIGVEFMTPSVTSSGMFELLNLVLGESPNPLAKTILEQITNTTILENNKHIKYFDSDNHGYSTIEFTKDYCDWKCYAIDKSVNDGNQEPVLLKHYRKVPGNHLLQDLT